jgi:hypothetical protein
VGGVSAEEDKIGFIWSGYNSVKYGWTFQERSLALLELFGIKYEKITDDEARDPELLSRYKVITAVSTYMLPDDVVEALVEYVKGGGKLVWSDAPTKVTNQEFHEIFGFSNDDNNYLLMRNVKFRPTNKNETGVDEVKGSGVANAYISSEVSHTSQVWFTIEGMMARSSKAEYEERSINGIVVNKYGKGTGILINWIVTSTGDLSLRSIYPEMILWALSS